MSAFILQRDDGDGRERMRHVARIVQELEALPLETPWRVEIEQVKSKRSLEANAYYWGVVIELISEHTGYESAELHEYFCGLRWGWRDKKVPKTPRNPAGIESVPVRTTTTNERGKRSVLGIMKFYEYVEFVRRFATVKLNLVIPDPDKGWRLHGERARRAA